MAPKTQPKVHLRSPHWRTQQRAACGLIDPRRHTTDPAEVTCRLCMGTVAMADAEIAHRRRAVQ